MSNERKLLCNDDWLPAGIVRPFPERILEFLTRHAEAARVGTFSDGGYLDTQLHERVPAQEVLSWRYVDL